MVDGGWWMVPSPPASRGLWEWLSRFLRLEVSNSSGLSMRESKGGEKAIAEVKLREYEFGARARLPLLISGPLFARKCRLFFTFQVEVTLISLIDRMRLMTI